MMFAGVLILLMCVVFWRRHLVNWKMLFVRTGLNKSDIVKLILRQSKPSIRYSRDQPRVDHEEAYYYNLLNVYEMNRYFAELPDEGETQPDGDLWTATTDVKEQSKIHAAMMREKCLAEYGIDLEKLRSGDSLPTKL